MNPEIYKKSDAIQKAFTPDIDACEDPDAIKKWKQAFLNLELADTVTKVSYASSDIFQAGARYLRDVGSYNRFRSMYHTLFDEIAKLEREDVVD